MNEREYSGSYQPKIILMKLRKLTRPLQKSRRNSWNWYTAKKTIRNVPMKWKNSGRTNSCIW